MRPSLYSAVLLLASSSPLLAQEHGEGPVNLLAPNTGLMFWTLLIFIVLLAVLWPFAFKPLTKAVADREAHLEQMIKEAQADREKAQQLLAEQQRALDASRAEAQRIIAEGRTTAERLRNELLEQTKHQQHELMERARADIDTEKRRAIAELRREAVELAIAGASKVIERNLDERTNREIVERFLASVPPAGARSGA